MEVRYDKRVSKQIEKLPKKDIADILSVVDLFEKHGFAITSIYLKKLSTNLWELRAGRWRLLFGIVQRNVRAVHLFYKRTQKTPKHELTITIKRLQGYL
jgi:phage-related protein